MGKAREGDYKQLIITIKFVVDTRNVGLKLEPTEKKGLKWSLECYSDSDWGGDKDN